MNNKKIRILGLSGATRTYGNTAILLNEALNGAEKNGAYVEVLNLYDFNIKPCHGCLNCVLYGKCKNNDDFEELMKILTGYDGIIVGSPNYSNNITSIFKQMSDRVYLVYSKYFQHFKSIKVSVFINYFYENFQQALPLSLLTFTFRAMQFKIVDTKMFHATSIPGGVVSYEKSISNAFKMGVNIVDSIKKNKDCSRGNINICPDCYSNFFIFKENNEVQCPVCSRTGRLENGKVVFKEEYNNVSYLSNNWLDYHFKEVLKSLEYDQIKDLSKIRKKYINERMKNKTRLKPNNNLQKGN